MPLKYLGLGIRLYGKPALFGLPAALGYSLDLMFRIGWQGHSYATHAALRR